MEATLKGRCACGAVRYRLASDPMFVHCCHCQDCQRQTGSAFVLNALIETDRVERLSGETEGVAVPTESGQPHVIHRCPACKVALWSHYGGVQRLSFVRVGTLDKPAHLPPDVASIRVRSCRGSRCPRTSQRSKLTMIPRSSGWPKAWSAARRSSDDGRPQRPPAPAVACATCSCSRGIVRSKPPSATSTATPARSGDWSRTFRGPTVITDPLISVWPESEPRPPAFPGVCRGWFANGFLYGLRSASTPNRARGD
jgi:hypothetical protein